jgi:hypothetical protein
MGASVVFPGNAISGAVFIVIKNPPPFWKGFEAGIRGRLIVKQTNCFRLGNKGCYNNTTPED